MSQVGSLRMTLFWGCLTKFSQIESWGNLLQCADCQNHVVISINVVTVKVASVNGIFNFQCAFLSSHLTVKGHLPKGRKSGVLEFTKKV